MAKGLARVDLSRPGLYPEGTCDGQDPRATALLLAANAPDRAAEVYTGDVKRSVEAVRPCWLSI